jgi:hypothetical protein
MDREFEVEITDIYKRTIKVAGPTRADAIYKAEVYYAAADDGCSGIADSESHVETHFKVLN